VKVVCVDSECRAVNKAAVDRRYYDPLTLLDQYLQTDNHTYITLLLLLIPRSGDNNHHVLLEDQY